MTDPTAPRYRLVLAKEDFKFSCAHFTVFSPDDAELLHGHNYHVAVEVAGPRLDDYGLLADIATLKVEIRRLCDELDSHVLLPTENDLVRVEEGDGEVEVRYAGRRYLLPAVEVKLLPLVNTSMELFARHLWQRLDEFLAAAVAEPARVDFLSVEVAETLGQKAVYQAGRGVPS